MKDITEHYTALYHPLSALVFYQSEERKSDMYVEHFDMDKRGNLINAHPLTVRESGRLSKALKISEEKEPCLKPLGLIGNHILHLDAIQGKAVWFTRAQKKELYFTEDLGIPSGQASIPPMLWQADRNSLSVFALLSNRRPTIKTPLYNAPFFNISHNGKVCMGTVDVQIKKTASLEEFTTKWEGYFFNSYFSHLMENHNPIRGNCLSLWQDLIQSGAEFPKEVLTKTRTTLKNLLL
jgi:PRTRC genetic system protein B